MIKTLSAVVVALAAGLAGCSTITDALTRLEAPQKAARAVDEYCVSIPYRSRLDTRQAVNTLTNEGDAFIYCNGDPDAPATE